MPNHPKKSSLNPAEKDNNQNQTPADSDGQEISPEEHTSHIEPSNQHDPSPPNSAQPQEISRETHHSPQAISFAELPSADMNEDALNERCTALFKEFEVTQVQYDLINKQLETLSEKIEAIHNLPYEQGEQLLELNQQISTLIQPEHLMAQLTNQMQNESAALRKEHAALLAQRDALGDKLDANNDEVSTILTKLDLLDDASREEQMQVNEQFETENKAAKPQPQALSSTRLR